MTRAHTLQGEVAGNTEATLFDLEHLVFGTACQAIDHEVTID